MRNLFALIIVAAVATTASAGTLELFFSTAGAGNPPAVANLGDPTEYADGIVPSVNPGETVYLWALTGAGEVWNGFGLGFDHSAAATPTSGELYDWQILGALPRWNPGSDFDATDGSVFGVAVQEQGLGAALEDLKIVPSNSGDGRAAILVAEVTFDTPGEVFMFVTEDWITMSGGSPADDMVVFGPGDDPVLSRVTGNTSANADLIIVPEPASVLLLGLAGLFLRRR